MCCKCITGAALLLIACGCAGGKETARQLQSGTKGEETMLDQLYADVVKSIVKEYAEARDELLKKEGIEKFLGRVAAKAPTGSEERWLARILLARQQEPNEFKKLEQVFVEKTSLCFYSMKITHEVVSPTPHFAHEPLPTFEELLRRNESRSWAENDQAFLKAQQLPESPLWADFLGEIAMKGWALPPVEQRLFEGGKLWTGSLRGQQHPTFSEDETLCHVVMLLGKLKERRARVAVERIVRDGKREELLRKLAAVCLGQLGDERSVEVLLAVVEDSDAPDPVRNWAVDPIGQIDGENAVAALERLINNPNIKTSNGRTFESAAANALQKLQQRAQQAVTH